MERIAPRTLSRQLAARGATTARLTKAKPVFRRFERSHFGDLWQSDAMHGPKLPDPANPAEKRATSLFAFIDDHTRLVPHAQFYWNEQLPRLEDCLKRGILRYGRPLGNGLLRSEYDGFVMGRAHGIYFYPGDAVLGMAIRDEAPLIGPYPEDYFTK